MEKQINSFPTVVEIQFEGEKIVTGYLIKSREDLWDFCGELAQEAHKKKAGYRFRIVK